MNYVEAANFLEKHKTSKGNYKAKAVLQLVKELTTPKEDTPIKQGDNDRCHVCTNVIGV